jgi:arsenate reductase-like glutaredoxin family protein
MTGAGGASTLRVQIFGRRDSRETQKALRFFRDRGIEVSFVDLAARPPAPAELRRFADRVGPAALLDLDGKRSRELGLGHLRMEPAEIVERLLADPRLLRLPLVRNGSEVSIGMDESTWRRWLSVEG